MKKQFLAISLLLSMSGAQADFAKYAPALATGALAFYGINEASHWKGDPNAEGILTTCGEIAGTTGRGMLTAANTGLVLATVALAVPESREVVLPAALLGAGYVTVKRLLGGSRQTSNPTDMQDAAAWTVGGAILGGIKVSNYLPAFTNTWNAVFGNFSRN